MSLVNKYTLNRLTKALVDFKVDTNGIVVIDGVLRTSLESGFEEYLRASQERDDNVVIKNVMQDILSISEKEVSEIMNRVQSNLDAKNRKREEILALQDIIHENQFPTQFIYTDINGNELIATLDNKEKAIALLQFLESILQTLADMSQMNMMKLQTAMNKMAQTMWSLSNIMKNMHDTLKAIIQNLRG